MKNKSKGISLDYMAGHYDKLTLSEKSRFRQKQIKLAGIEEKNNVLEVGCGPGMLSILSKMIVGDTGEVCGIDIAPKMIEAAVEKAKKYGFDIDFKVASIDKIPYPDEYFDVVISSLMFHHLPVGIKEKGLIEIKRVIKEGGKLFLCDFGTPRIITALLMFLLLIWIRSTRYQLLGKLPKLIKSCGFRNIKLVKNGLFLKYYIIKK